MSCLAHDKRFRSSFHNIINELRNEKRMPVEIIRSMPNKCCTCNDENKETIETVIMKEENQFMKLKNLIERVNREKQTNPKLILSLNRFENFINEHRSPTPLLSESLSVSKHKKNHSLSVDNSSSSDSASEDESRIQNSIKTRRIVRSSSSDESSSSSDDEDIMPMEITKSVVRRGRQQNQKVQIPSKPIKNGTFLFLPYNTKNTTKGKKPDPLVDVAKTLLLKRFIGRNGHIASLEKQYGVRINMITPKTSKQVMNALEDAKKGLENLTIRNQNGSSTVSESHEGQWVLVRSKKPQKKTNPTDFEQALDDLTNRWESCLHIKKRNGDEADNSNDSTRKRQYLSNK